MVAALYKTKKALRENIGKPLRYLDPSLFGASDIDNSKFPVVGPGLYERKWYAVVETKNGLIYKVK